MQLIVEKRGYRILPLLALAVAIGFVVLLARTSLAESDLGPFEIDGFPVDADGNPLPAAADKSYYSGNDGPPADDWADGGPNNGVFALSPSAPHTAGVAANCYGSNVDLNGGYSPFTTRFICDGNTGIAGYPEYNIVSPSGDIPDDIWPIKPANNVTPKDDLSHGYFLLENQPCSDGTLHTVVIVGMERGNNEGANHWGIELNKIPPTGLLTVADNVPPAANFALDFNRTAGDVFVSVELERGGTEPTITVTQVQGTPAQGQDATFVLASPGAICPDFADNRTSTNLVEQQAPPWNIISCDPTSDGGKNSCRIANQAGSGAATQACGTGQNKADCTRLAARDFVEVGIDLTAYGLGASCFADVLLSTRSAPPGGIDPATGEVDLSGADVKDVTAAFLDVCSIDVIKTGDTLGKVGDPVDYTITVENTGQLRLYKDDIADTLLGAIVSNGVDQASVPPVTFNSNTCNDAGKNPLQPGDTCTITASRIVQAGDPDPLPNIVTVDYNDASDFSGTSVSDSDDHSVNLFQPSITLDKTGDELSKIGDSVNYTITFNNTSSADTPDLTCDFSDSLLGTLDQDVVVASGGSHVINTSRTVQAGDPDPLVNTASVTCTVGGGFGNTLTASEGHSVNLFQPSITLDKTGDELSKVGDSVNYTITFNNTSSADTPALTCDFSDSLLGTLDQDVVVASGGSHVINTSRTVQAGDPDPLTNTASVTCTVGGGFGNTLTASEGHSVNLFQPSITIDKTGDTLSKVGDSVDYTITFNNTSSADTPDLTCDFSDSLLGTLDQDVVVASGGNHVINTSRVVLAGDPDPLTNTASVTCTVGGGFGNTLTASEGHSVNLFQPSITIDKTGDTLSKVGDSVDYTITFNNTSSADTPDLTCDFSDSLLGTLDQDVVVASGGNHVINTSRVVLAGDPDPLTNTASVTCTVGGGFGNTLTASEGHSVNLFQPSITIDKTGDTLSKVGDSVDYTITFNNTSSADTPDLTCDFSDSLLGTLDQDVVVASGGNHVINTSRVVQAGDPDPLTNTASVTCTVGGGFGNTLTASEGHSVNLFQPSITLDKTGDTLSKVGDSVDYTITFNNTSSADAPALTCDFSDSLLGTLDQDVVVASGGSHVIPTSHTVLPSDPDPLVNTASVTCTVNGFGNALTASEGHSVDLFQPSITLDKTGDTLSKVGDSVNYTITFNNTSSADTPDLTCDFSDSLLGTLDQDVVVASGGSHVINTSRTVQAGDPDPLVNTASVTCTVGGGFGNTLTASDPHSVNLFQPAIAVDKTGDPLSKVGDPVDYTITLSNNSSADTPALNCVATDSLLGEVFNGVLPPGDTVINRTRTVLPGDPDPLVNSVSMTCTVADFGNTLTASEGHSTNLFQPAVEVIKTGPATAVRGETITYFFTINNLSSADSPDLVLDSVTDTVLGDLTAAAAAGGCGTLASGGSCNFTVDYTIALDDPSPLCNTVTVHYHPDGFPNDVTDDDDHCLQIPIQGCTPGFWQGGAGSQLWNQVNDPQWIYGGTNPYIHTTLFNSFFNVVTDPRLDGYTMYALVSTGGGSDPAVKAARDMVAAYLNESAFPADFPADSLNALLTMWYDAVAAGDAGLTAFHNIVAGWNSPAPPGYCPLP